MSTRKAGKTRRQEPSPEEGIFVRKMFAYALVAMESLPSHRRDQPFLELAQKVLEHYPEPTRIMRYVDDARERIQQRGEIVRLDDYRYRYSTMRRD